MESARRATPADAERIVALAHDARVELAQQRGGALLDRERSPLTPDGVLVALADPDRLVLVGCLDDVVVGYALAHQTVLRDGTRLAVVGELAVEPDARAVGVGEALVGAALDWASAAGCTGVDATALPGMRATKNFFEAHGFTARVLTMHRPLGG